jgi:F0F1-type ATP synthase gamma subunit
VSALSYEAHTTAVISAQALREAAGFQQYEMEEDVSKDLAEFALANAIYTALVEGHAAEISARRTAMENASNVSAAVIHNKITPSSSSSRITRDGSECPGAIPADPRRTPST